MRKLILAALLFAGMAFLLWTQWASAQSPAVPCAAFPRAPLTPAKVELLGAKAHDFMTCLTEELDGSPKCAALDAQVQEILAK